MLQGLTIFVKPAPLAGVLLQFVFLFKFYGLAKCYMHYKMI